MLTDLHIAELWVRMARIYGHRWTTHFGASDDGTWLAGLQHLTADQLATGMRAVIARGDAWPPSLPEFRLICLGLPRRDRAVADALAGEDTLLARRMRAEVGQWDMDHLYASDLRVRLAQAYDTAVERLMAPGAAAMLERQA